MFAGVYVTFSVYSAMTDLGEYFDDVINDTNKPILVTGNGFSLLVYVKIIKMSQRFFILNII